jgi:hypothetical protein
MEIGALRNAVSSSQLGEHVMTKLKDFVAVALLSMAATTPVFAQAAIQEPGAYAFYHPNGDVLETNRPWPREPAGAMAAVPPRAIMPIPT